MRDNDEACKSEDTPVLPESASVQSLIELTDAEAALVSGGLDGASKDAAY